MHDSCSQSTLVLYTSMAGIAGWSTVDCHDPIGKWQSENSANSLDRQSSNYRRRDDMMVEVIDKSRAE